MMNDQGELDAILALDGQSITELEKKKIAEAMALETIKSVLKRIVI